jgi:hypothetical protein
MKAALLLALASKASGSLAPSITTSQIFPPLTVGVPFNGSISAANANGATGAITFSASALPPGLTLGAAFDTGGGGYTAQVTGTPTTAGSVDAVFTITNGTLTVTPDYLFIVAGSPAITTSLSLPDAEVGAAYSGYVHGTNAGGASGAMTYAADVLPAGLSIDSTTGNVTGAGTTEAFTNTVFTVTNGTQTVHPTHTFKIGHPAALVANVTGTLNDGTSVNVSVTQGSRVPMVPAQPLRGSVMFHADGLSICLENAYAGLTNDLTGTFSVAVGSTTLWTGDLTIWAYSRTRPFWVSAPPLLPSPALWRFPTYGTGSESSSSYDWYHGLPTTHDVNSVDNSPMGIGIHRRTFGAAGGSPQFGPLPGWDAQWMCNPTANNLIVVRGMADSVGVWPHIVIDPTTNKMIDVSAYAKLTMDSGQRGVVGNPIVPFTTKIWVNSVGINFDQVQNHCTNFCALSTVLYGTDFDKEAIALWANYVGSIVSSWPSRVKINGNPVLALGSASRGLGRSMRSVTYAAVLSDSQAYFSQWMALYANALSARYAAQTGIHIDQTNAAVEGYAHYGYAPWQEHALTQAVGNTIRNGFTAMQPVADYLFAGAIEAALDTPHEYASLFDLVWRSGDGSSKNPPAANFAGVIANTAGWNTSIKKSLDFPENDVRLVGLAGDQLVFGGSTTLAAAQVGVPWVSTLTLLGWFTPGAIDIADYQGGETLPDGTVGKGVSNGGSAPLPSWISYAISGHSVYFYGTPPATGIFNNIVLNITDPRIPVSVQQAPITIPVYDIGSIKSVAITSKGSGYVSGSTVTFVDNGGSGSGATATMTAYQGSITGITMTNPGAGYSSNVSVVIGGSGSGAAFTINRLTAAMTPQTPPTTGNSAVSISPYLAGDFAGHPEATDSFGVMFRMAVAEAANFATDQTRAQAAWNVTFAHVRPSAVAPANMYASNPQYNIVKTP